MKFISIEVNAEHDIVLIKAIANSGQARQCTIHCGDHVQLVGQDYSPVRPSGRDHKSYELISDLPLVGMRSRPVS